MSYNTLFNPKIVFDVLKLWQDITMSLNYYQFLSRNYIYTHFWKSKYLNVLHSQHIYFDLSKVKYFKTHKQRKW